MNIDDFNGDNFDHGGIGLLRRRLDRRGNHQRPADRRRGRCRPARRAGAANGRQATAKWYNHAFNIDASGCELRAPRQLSRPRSDLQGCARPSADPHDATISAKTTSRWRNTSARSLAEIAQAMNPTHDGVRRRARRGNYDIVPYQSTHNTGGTIMGTDPKTSVVNRYLPVLGRRQPVRHGRVAVPAERRHTTRPGRSARWPIGRRRRSPSAMSRARPAGSGLIPFSFGGGDSMHKRHWCVAAIVMRWAGRSLLGARRRMPSAGKDARCGAARLAIASEP